MRGVGVLFDRKIVIVSFSLSPKERKNSNTTRNERGNQAAPPNRRGENAAPPKEGRRRKAAARKKEKGTRNIAQRRRPSNITQQEQPHQKDRKKGSILHVGLGVCVCGLVGSRCGCVGWR